MAQAGPQGSGRVVAHRYEYAVSDKWIQERIDEEGIQRPKVWEITFELRELPDADARRRARRLREAWEAVPGRMELREPTEDPVEFLDLVEEWADMEAETVLGAKNEEAEQEERKQQEQQEFEAEMGRWIPAHGSVRLKLARDRGYKIVSTYAKERGREELPECWIDTADRAQYRERVDPTIRALKVETSFRQWLDQKELDLQTWIIWLVQPPSAMLEYRESLEESLFIPEFEQQEALIIKGFLGKYDAFLLVDIDERVPRDSVDDAEEN